MFREPLPATLLSREQARKIKEKLRVLKRLRKHPRSSLPEMEVPFDQLKQTLKWILSCANFPSTAENRHYISIGNKKRHELENIIVRVVVSGEEYNDVVAASQ